MKRDNDDDMKQIDDFRESEEIYNLFKEAFYTSDRSLTFKNINQLKIHEEEYPELIRFINRHIDNLNNPKKD